MISEKMKPYVKNNSAIRMMFEEGNRLRAKYGADKVFDFTPIQEIQVYRHRTASAKQLLSL